MESHTRLAQWRKSPHHELGVRSLSLPTGILPRTGSFHRDLSAGNERQQDAKSDFVVSLDSTSAR
jgi:hypothetical protein